MEETYFGYRFLLLVMIVGLNAFFASAEMALISARPSRLRELASGGAVGAQAALNLLEHPERLLFDGASWGSRWPRWERVGRRGHPLPGALRLLQPLATPRTQTLLHGACFVTAFLALAFVMVVLGEVVPRIGPQAERALRGGGGAIAADLLSRLATLLFVLERSRRWSRTRWACAPAVRAAIRWRN